MTSKVAIIRYITNIADEALHHNNLSCSTMVPVTSEELAPIKRSGRFFQNAFEEL
jgi:hypothetical protein